MRVRVTIARQVEEYLDVMVSGVESIDEGVAKVQAQLTDSPSSRARVVNNKTWLRGEVVSDVTIVESANAD